MIGAALGVGRVYPYLRSGRIGKGDKMAQVELYTTLFCPYCARAHTLLKKKGVAYTDIDINEHPEKRAEMLERAHGGYTVPQIFINGEHIGGSDELVALDRKGELDKKLGIAG